jgi:hypothetical protein
MARALSFHSKSHRPPLLTFALFLLLLFPGGVTLAETTDIGNGKLFQCVDGVIRSVKTGETVLQAKAIKKFKKIIRRKKAAIASAPKGSRKRKRAVAAKKAARQGIADTKECDGGDGSSLDGLWSLVTENGMTPSEAGFTSLTLQIDSGGFTSILQGPTSCIWSGAFSSTETEATVTTSSASGDESCQNAVGNTRVAALSLSNNGNTLTLDYTANAGGTLQVYMRVS